MNRILIFLFLYLIIQLGTSQITFSQEPDTSREFVYPTIIKYGKVLNDFSPKNWDITDTISGDLNKDGVDDFALIVVYKDSIKINDGYRFPRILLLVFKVGDHYELKLQHNTLIEYALLNENGNTGGWDGDPLENMEIANGVLKLHFKSDIRGALTFTQYIVRYQSNDFYLIGATCTSGYRASETTSDFNFSTGRYTYDMTDDETGFGGTFDEEHKKGKLPKSALKKLIEIEGDEYWTPSDFIK